MLIVNLWHNTLENLLLNEDQVLQGCLSFHICMLYQKPIRVETCNGPLGKQASEYSIC